ncbi:MAG: S41 family peptidase [Thermoanaerobaculia bacterium]
MRSEARRLVIVLGAVVIAGGSLPGGSAVAQQDPLAPQVGHEQILKARAALAGRPVPRSPEAPGLTSPQDRRQAVDAYWGEGLSTADKLVLFDKFWQYADGKFAAFQGIDVDWAALRDRYRGEIAAGVSRGRFAGIMNHLTLALRDSHTRAFDVPVNVFSVPQPGVPLLALSAWTYDTSGTCETALADGSALVYSAIPGHPLGLEPGDRILGYDGRPWRELYQELLREELPLWPLWWGSSPSSFDHSFVMAAGMNWHLFDTMDIAKHGSGKVVHVPTSLMPGVIWHGFCSEQMDIAGVPKPADFFNLDFVSSGIVAGTHIGYIYVWGWLGNAGQDFAQAVNQLTQVEHVDGLIIDFRFNNGGFITAPFLGLAELFAHPTRTIGYDDRKNPADHFKMERLFPPSGFKMDFDVDGNRIKASYGGPIAVLVGPGAVSAGDLSAFWATFLPRARSFGKSTSTAFTIPTQPLLGTSLDLDPDWETKVGEANAFAVGAPHDYLTHREFPVDEQVWLKPDDVAAGKDTVVEAALRWIRQQIGGN